MLWISLLLLLGNAFFVGAEFAVMAARRSQLMHMARKNGIRIVEVDYEVDHLDGILYPSRIKDFSTFGFTDVLFPEIGEGK